MATSHPRTRRIITAAAATTLLALGAGSSAEAKVDAEVKFGVLTVTSDGAGDNVALRPEFGNPDFVVVDFGDNGTVDRDFNRNNFAGIDVQMGGGADRAEIEGAAADGTLVTVSGGDGDDTLIGGDGVESFAGGPGNDTVDGNNADDKAFLGA